MKNTKYMKNPRPEKMQAGRGEIARLRALYSFDILDSPDEARYDNIVELTAAICEAPVSVINLIDSQRQWFKAETGLNLKETSLDISYCIHCNDPENLLIIEDTAKDVRSKDNPLTSGPAGFKFYAGAPLVTEGDYIIGTLCVLDRKPRTLTPFQKKALKTLAAEVMTNLELRKKLIESEKLTQKLEDEKKTARYQSAAIESVLNVLAHDINSPLADIDSLLALAEEGQLTREQLQDLLLKLKSRVGTTRQMVHEILEWGQDSLKSEEPEVEFSLKNTVNKVVMTLKHLIDKKDLHLHVDIDDDIIIKTCKHTFSFVLRNLLQNAVKFSESGIITIAAQKNADEEIEVSVTDEGIGMTETQQKKVLSDQSYTSNGTHGEKGTGMGLHFTKLFLSRINSRLHISSEKGKGTRMWFTVKNRE